MNRIFIFLFIVTFGCGCRSLPKEYSKASGRSLVEGVVTQKKPNPNTALFGVLLAPPNPDDEPPSITRVQILKVDETVLPETTAFYYANKAWLEPGIHKIIISCSTEYSWGSVNIGTNIDIDVQSGYNYYVKSSAVKLLSAQPFKISTPDVDVTKKPSN